MSKPPCRHEPEVPASGQSIIMSLAVQFCDSQAKGAAGPAIENEELLALLKNIAGEPALTIEDAAAQIILGGFVLELVNEKLVENGDRFLVLAQALFRAAQPAILREAGEGFDVSRFKPLMP